MDSWERGLHGVPYERLLTAPEVAALFRVKPGTVTRWAAQGLLPAIQVREHGQRRYRESVVQALLRPGEVLPPAMPPSREPVRVSADVLARNNRGGRP